MGNLGVKAAHKIFELPIAISLHYQPKDNAAETLELNFDNQIHQSGWQR